MKHRTHDAGAPPTLSIVTIVRNGEHTIAKTILSVHSQKEAGVEYIVIDGNSEDATMSVVESYRPSIDRIVSEPDAGIYDAMNKGVRLSRGRWLLFLNAGDVLRPGMMQLLLRRIQQSATAVDLICGKVDMVDADGQRFGYTHPPKIGSTRWLLMENCVAHQATLMRRTVFERFGPYSTEFRIMGDYEYWIRLLRGGARFDFVDDTIADFAANGLSSQRSSVLRAKREQMRTLTMHGFKSPAAARAHYALTAVGFHAKSAIRALIGSRLSEAIRVARARAR